MRQSNRFDAASERILVHMRTSNVLRPPSPGGARRDGTVPPAAPPSAATTENSGPLAYKWMVLIAVVFGLFMAVLDATVVNIALAKLQAVFGATLDSIQWVVTGYTLSLTVSVT